MPSKRRRPAVAPPPLHDDALKTPAELELEAYLFGTGGGVAAPGAAADRPAAADADGEDESPTAPSAAWVDDDDAPEVSLASVKRLRKLRHSASEDLLTAATFEARLRDRFNTLRPAPAWARVSASTAADGGDERISALLATTAPVVETPSSAGAGRLPAQRVEVTRERDGNAAEPSRAVVQALQFHHDGRLLMTAGFDKVMRFFDVDGDRNRKVAGVALPDMPVHCAAFAGARGDSVIVSGRRPFFYVYDCASGRVTKVPGLMGRAERSLERFAVSPCGACQKPLVAYNAAASSLHAAHAARAHLFVRRAPRAGEWIAFTAADGFVVLVSRRTRQWVADFKMHGTSRAVAFVPTAAEGGGGGWTPSVPTLLSSGSDGEVYVWDVRSRRCLSRFQNEGGTVTSSLACAGGAGAGYIAAGSESGVVNVYDAAALVRGGATGTPAPLRALSSLTTSVDRLCFNSVGDAQILAMSSRRSKQALRLAHLPSCTVFQNWPTASTPTHFPSALAFSPDSRRFAVGNDRGRALLYRLEHYT